uniref:Uncharacterized protein n=1 Tax=Sus scrofa TaxID=9823 RepID=A0A8D1PRH9_PIG
MGGGLFVTIWRNEMRQGLQAGSPPPLPGTCRPGGCRAPGWPTPPAPRKTFSPATPRPRSSKRSARSSCGSRRSRAPCRTSTADRPRLPHLPSICFLWKQDWKERTYFNSNINNKNTTTGNLKSYS